MRIAPRCLAGILFVPMKRRRILLVLISIPLAIGVFFVWQIGPRNVIGMLRYDQRREGTLRVGDRVPDVALVKLDGRGETRLSAYVGDKPLVIVFGSFT